jgi:hypothetical protein
MSKKPVIIQFTASISQVRTMADGGLRVILDFDEGAIQAASDLMKVKQAGGLLEIAAVAIIQKLPEKATKGDDAAQKTAERKSPRTNIRRR